MKRNTKCCAHGFSLIEVLVAISMVALALMAGMAVSMTLMRFAERQPALELAQLCAQNDLVRLRLRHQLPQSGEHETQQRTGQRPSPRGGRRAYH